MKTQNIDDLETKGGAIPPVIDPAAVKQELDAIGAKADQALAALANTPSADEITALKGSIEAVKSSVEGLPYADHAALIKALDDRVDELQTGAALLGNKAADQPEGIRAISRLIEDSPTYKSIFDANGDAASPIAAPGGWSAKTRIPSFAASGGYKTPTPVGLSDLSGLNLTAYRAGVISDPLWAMNIASRIPSVIVKGATTYVLPKEDGASVYGAWTTVLTAAIDGDPTPKSTADFAEVDGLMIGSVIKFWNTSTDALIGQAVVVSVSTLTVTFVTNSLDFDVADGSRVTSENYGVTAEKGTKPNGWIGIGNVSFTMKNLATIVPTTVNALNTVPGLQSMIEGKLPARDIRNLSRHLLYGDDGAGQLQGLTTYTGAQTYSWSSGVSGDNQIDAMIRSAMLIPMTGPVSIIMSQVDLPQLFLLKGSDGHYLRTGNFGAFSLTQVAGTWFLGPYELVFDYALASGDFIPINFAEASEIADADVASLMWGYIDDDFEINVIRARYEATRCHAIKSVAAYIVAEWDAAP